MSDFIAALSMYDWPEERAEVDALWATIRDRLRAAGVDAPDNIIRDFADIHALWRQPNLLLAQTCWGPMEQGLAEHVQVVGQPSYDGIEGGQGELYSSAIVMRVDLPVASQPSDKSRSTLPPSVLPDISPTRGEIGRFSAAAPAATPVIGETFTAGAISPLVGEMSGRTEGGNVERVGSMTSDPAPPLHLLRNTRFAFNSSDSMSGLIALTRDLEAMGESLDIFSDRIETGGHRNSIIAVAESRADVATIDCRSWALAQKHEPAAQKLQVVGWTAKRKGLPFITAKATPADVVAKLRAAVAGI